MGVSAQLLAAGRNINRSRILIPKDKNDISLHINCVVILSFVRCYDRCSYPNKPECHLILVDVCSEGSESILMSTSPCFRMFFLCVQVYVFS